MPQDLNQASNLVCTQPTQTQSVLKLVIEDTLKMIPEEVGRDPFSLATLTYVAVALLYDL